MAGPWDEKGGSDGKLSIEPENERDEPGCWWLWLFDEWGALLNEWDEWDVDGIKPDSFRRSLVNGGGSDGGAWDGGGWDGGGIKSEPIAGLCGVVNGENCESILVQLVLCDINSRCTFSVQTFLFNMYSSLYSISYLKQVDWLEYNFVNSS